MFDVGKPIGISAPDLVIIIVPMGHFEPKAGSICLGFIGYIATPCAYNFRF